MNWNEIFSKMGYGLVETFSTGELSYNDFYKQAVVKGCGPEVRKLKSSGVKKSRSLAKAALKRRGVIS